MAKINSNNSESSVNQESLFDFKEKGSRPKDEPLEVKKKTKGTNSSASVFGWEFQISSAIVLSFMNIEELKSVTVEGNTEDIELYFADEQRLPAYIQVKSQIGNPVDNKDKGQAARAMNTLINTSNIQHGQYSSLIYVVNFRNPWNLPDDLLRTFWKPEMDKAFVESYDGLPDDARLFMDEKIKLGQKTLGEKYLNTLDNFRLENLSIMTMLCNSLSKENKFSVLEGTLKRFFAKSRVNVKPIVLQNIMNSLQTSYFDNAGTSKTNDHYAEITKEELIWRLIIQIFGEVPDDFWDQLPPGIEDDLNDYEGHFIKRQSENIEVINKILAGWQQYAERHSDTSLKSRQFIQEEWHRYKDLFPVEAGDPEDVQMYAVQMIMLKVVLNNRNINKLKKGGHLE